GAMHKSMSLALKVEPFIGDPISSPLETQYIQFYDAAAGLS
ncbi:hypothetical protein MNBD_GAMMA02-1820, partial [hydrothermal vent metagenome]